MGIGAINGFSIPDYSSYTHINQFNDSDAFDAVIDDIIDQSDFTDKLGAISTAELIVESQNPYAKINPVDYSEKYNQDTMHQDRSSSRAEMEDLHLVAMGFHTKRRNELLASNEFKGDYLGDPSGVP